jgi:histidine ammonia-lyase
MYGTNTGIGEFSEVVLNDEQVKQFQRYLIYNHAAGIGEPAPIEYVRGAMAGRINVHAHGNSGCRPEITLTLIDMLNKGVTPVVCQKGSVGACGDLAPMAQLALLLMGEGEAFYQGERLPGWISCHQRLQSINRYERHPPVRYEPLAETGRDRLLHEPGSAFR